MHKLKLNLKRGTCRFKKKKMKESGTTENKHIIQKVFNFGLVIPAE